MKRNFIRFTKNIIETDIGWIFENIKTESYISMKSIKSDLNPIYDNYMYWITLESPHVISKSKRSYLKAQELLAKVGGLFNGLFIVLMILLYHYKYKEYYSELHKKLTNHPLNKISKAQLKDDLSKAELKLKILLISKR